jgi:RNA polymerase sigma-70 factor (ECF subfamily)
MGSSLAEPRPPRPLAGLLDDEVAFRAWYDATLPRVYGYVYQRCGRDPDLAQELTQQTFVDAVRTGTRSAVDDGVAWVIVIARRRLADHFRALERRERGRLRLIGRGTTDAVVWLGDRDPDDRLADALRRLPAAQRAAVVLCYLDDLPVREAARVLGRSEGAMESLLSRARETLRRALGDER